MSNRYHYKACSIDGRWTEGEIVALSQEEALARLQAAGVYVTALVPVKSRKRRFSSDPVYISEQERIFLLESLAMFLEAGLPMQSALLNLRLRTRSVSVAHAIERVQQSIDGGKRVTEALGEAHLFPPSWVALLSVGEKQGDFVPLLRMLHQHAIEFRRLKQKLLSMLVMPSILLVLVGVWIWVFVNRVIPSFLLLTGDMEILKNLPAWIRWGGEVLVSSIRWSPLSLALLILFSRWNRRADREEIHAPSWIPLSLPVLGPLISQLQMIYVATGLRLQLEAGIPLVSAMEVVGRSLRNRVVRRDLLQAYRKLQEGVPVPEVLARIRILTPMGQPLLVVGDATGRLPEMLDFLIRETQANLFEQIHRLTILIRSLVILVTGLLVGGLIIVYFNLLFSSLTHFPQAHSLTLPIVAW